MTARRWRIVVVLALLALVAILVAVRVEAPTAGASSVPPAKAASVANGAKQAAVHTAAVTTPPLVPFIRTLTLGMKGCECATVFQLQRALKAAGVRPKSQKATGYYGKLTAEQVAAYQRKAHIKPVTGRYGTKTHHALSKWYDKAGRQRLQAVAHARKIVAITSAIVTVTAHAWLVRATMGYSQGPGRSIMPSYPHVQLDGDCSSYVTWVFHSVGLPDPSGFGYRVIGWTGTLAQHGVRIAANAKLRVGDLVFYGGGYPYGHVAIIVNAVKRLVSSHGTPGIHVEPYNYRPVAAIRRYF